MYFAVLRAPAKIGKVGSVFAVSKVFDENRNAVVVHAALVSYTNSGKPTWNKLTCVTLTQPCAREYFTKPSKDFDSVLEESFMVCEAAYC